MYPADLFLYDVVRPTLLWCDDILAGMHSEAAEQLLMGTAMAESGLRTVVQSGGGPAQGYFQMEPTTYRDIRDVYLGSVRPDLQTIEALQVLKGGQREIRCNPVYACAYARVHYWRRPDPLPAAGDWQALGEFWKRLYNTPLGAGTLEHWHEATAPIRALW